MEIKWNYPMSLEEAKKKTSVLVLVHVLIYDNYVDPANWSVCALTLITYKIKLVHSNTNTSIIIPAILCILIILIKTWISVRRIPCPCFTLVSICITGRFCISCMMFVRSNHFKPESVLQIVASINFNLDHYETISSYRWHFDSTNQHESNNNVFAHSWIYEVRGVVTFHARDF